MDTRHDPGADGESPEEDASEDQGRADNATSQSARSGDFSQDPAFDPNQLFEVVGRAENDERVSRAMLAFLEHPDAALFERAIATFVRSARARGAPVESVLAVLIGLAQASEGTAYPHDWTLTDLRWMILRGVLLAFYGDASVGARMPGTERRVGTERRRGETDAPSKPDE